MFEYIRKNQNETQEQNIPQELAEKVVQEGGADPLEEILFSFILSVVASVIAYYICKWFDGD